MQPTQIPDEMVYGERIPIEPPSGHPEILPVEAVVDRVVGGPQDGLPRVGIRIQLTDEDLVFLFAHRFMWLFFVGEQIVPFFLVTEGELLAEEAGGNERR